MAGQELLLHVQSLQCSHTPIRQQPQLQFLAQVGSGVAKFTDSKDDPSAAGFGPSSEYSDGDLGGLSIR